MLYDVHRRRQRADLQHDLLLGFGVLYLHRAIPKGARC